MKKTSSIACIVLVLCAIVFCAPKKALAVDFGVGMYGYYAWWVPSFSNQYESLEVKPMFLWGPILSVGFLDKWNISLLVVQNVFNGSEGDITFRGTGSLGPGQIDDTRNLFRFDTDLTLSYSMFDQLKIFIGGKYMYCSFESASKEDIHVTAPYTLSNDGSLSEDWGGISSWGLSTGLSLNLNIIGGLFVMVNESFLCSRTSFDVPTYTEVPALSGKIGLVKEKNSYYGIGSNTTLALLYYIAPIQTSISLGGRFQVIHYLPGSGPDMDNDYFYGLTFSLMFVF